MIDAVWTVGHHPSLCGTEKFGHLLAKKLGVPCVKNRGGIGPSVSVGARERNVGMGRSSRRAVRPVFARLVERDGTIMPWVNEAQRVYAANPVIAREIRSMRPDVIEAFAPSTIEGNPTRGTINVLTFGMAHKLGIHRALPETQSLLDDAPTDYTVSVSTAIHEGSPWDETARVADQLREIFGSHLRVLGYLADDALAKELKDCTAVAIFFDPALRANNTTFWAALDAGCYVITNR
jgi:hypothetical protein